MEHRVELLAPAGNMEGFYGAVHAGADAVYVGGERFGARAYADNFSSEELLFCVRYAHIWNCRVYLTVNTLVKDAEIEALLEYLQPLYECGLDGVIVQDIGVLCLIRETFPELKLHASTQMTLTDSYGAALLRDMGVSRVVPARELSLAEIRHMKTESGLEVETFIHGAMCYSYSGQCLFSSILGGRSGNRGRCAQPCRLPYRVERDGRVTEECYPLSLKDLCMAQRLPELIEAGIDSFKIEGRMKKPEYAAGVTAVYRRCIDQYYETGRVSDPGLDELASLYIRSGRQEGYYFRHNGREMVTLDSPSYDGSDEELLRGIREQYIDSKLKREISVRAEFEIGKPAKVIFSVKWQGRDLRAAVEGDPVSEAVKQPVTRENIEKQLGKLGDTCFRAENLDILMDERIFYPLKAINELRRRAAALLEDAVIEANGFTVKRTGRVGFADVPEENAAQEAMCIAGDAAQNLPDSATDAGTPRPGGSLWHVAVRDAGQLQAVAEQIRTGRGKNSGDRISRLYLEADLPVAAAERGDQAFFELCREFSGEGCELVLALPYIIRTREEAFLQQMWRAYAEHRELFSGFLVRSMDGLGFIRRKLNAAVPDAEKNADGTGNSKPAVYADAGFYVWNRRTARVLQAELGLDGFCMPYELKASEQHFLLEGTRLPCEKLVYGRIPLMLTANCVVNTVDGCQKNQGKTACRLTDRYRKKFPVICDCRHCMNIIYNSVPLSLHGEMAKWRGKAFLRLDFTIESREETAEILRYFTDGADGAPVFGEYTTGHEKRGTE